MKAMRERWYEAILEEETLQSNKDIKVLCIDFCDTTTSKVHAVLQHAPSDLRGGSFLQHPRVLVATVDYQENPHLLPADTPCCHFPGFSRCIRTNSEVRSFLTRSNSSRMSVLSGPSTVITNVATASAVPADGRSTESVSRVQKTAKTRQEKMIKNEQHTHTTATCMTR